MTREDWHAHIESVPLTPNQRGRAHAEMIRLGVVDRGERLAIASALLDLDALDSFTSLTQGQAGKLVNILMHTRDRAGLLRTAAASGRDSSHHDHGSGADVGPGAAGTGSSGTAKPVTLAQAVRELALAAMIVWGRVKTGTQHAGAPSPPATSADT